METVDHAHELGALARDGAPVTLIDVVAAYGLTLELCFRPKRTMSPWTVHIKRLRSQYSDGRKPKLISRSGQSLPQALREYVSAVRGKTLWAIRSYRMDRFPMPDGLVAGNLIEALDSGGKGDRIGHA